MNGRNNINDIAFDVLEFYFEHLNCYKRLMIPDKRGYSIENENEWEIERKKILKTEYQRNKINWNVEFSCTDANKISNPPSLSLLICCWPSSIFLSSTISSTSPIFHPCWFVWSLHTLSLLLFLSLLFKHTHELTFLEILTSSLHIFHVWLFSLLRWAFKCTFMFEIKIDWT